MIFERKLCIEKFEIENIYQTEGMAAIAGRKTFIIYLDLDTIKRNVYFPSFRSKKILYN